MEGEKGTEEKSCWVEGRKEEKRKRNDGWKRRKIGTGRKVERRGGRKVGGKESL